MAKAFSIHANQVVVAVYGRKRRFRRHQRRLHKCRDAIPFKSLRPGNQPANPAFLPKQFHILRANVSDSCRQHVLRAHMRVKGQTGGNGNLAAGINSVDVRAGIRFRIGCRLRLLEHLIEALSRGLHGIQDQVGRAVYNSHYPGKPIRTPRPQQIHQIRNAAAYAGAEAEANAHLLRRVQQFLQIPRNHQLVRADNVLACPHGFQHETMSRLVASHQFHHRIYFRIAQDFRYVRRKQRFYALNLSLVQNPPNRYVLPGGQLLKYAGSNSTHSQQSDVHSHPPLCFSYKHNCFRVKNTIPQKPPDVKEKQVNFSRFRGDLCYFSMTEEKCGLNVHMVLQKNREALAHKRKRRDWHGAQNNETND